MDDRELFRLVGRGRGRTVKCPTCQADPGEQCYAKGYNKGNVLYRASNHKARMIRAAEELGLTSGGSLGVKIPTIPPVPKVKRPSRWQGLQRATPEETRAERCPECDAEPGHPCLWFLADGRRSSRNDHHTSRWVAAMKHLGRHPLW